MINYNDEIFTILPNSIVWSREEGELSLIRGLSDKIIAILTYINSKENRRGYSEFTLEELIKYCNLKPNANKGKSNEQFKNILNDMILTGMIVEIDNSVNSASAKSIMKVKFNLEVDKEFFSIKIDQVDKIMQEDKCDNILLLNVYSYILARLNRRTFTAEEESFDIKLGRSECVYASEENMAEDLGISKTTFDKSIKILKKLKLIFVDNIGLVKKDNKVHMANNVYVIDETEMRQALLQSEYFYKGEKYTIIGKKSGSEVKKFIGLSGKIAQELNKGNNTKELEDKLNGVKEIIEMNKVKKEVNESLSNKEIWGTKPKGLINRKNNFSEQPNIKSIEDLREEARKIVGSDLDKYKSVIDSWNKKYNTRLIDETNAWKIEELIAGVKNIKG